MSDLGADYAEKRIRELERALDRLYSDAQKEIEKKTDDFFRRSAAREKQKLAQVKSGKMTQEAFDKWKAGQVFIGKQWTEKERQMADTLAKYNQIALDLVDGKKFSVFAFNANYAAYYFEHDAGVGFGFGLYDSATVARMVADKPNILPFKKLDKKKDERWNWKNIRAQVTQGVVQGESIPQIAKRMQNVTGKNKTQATLYARTAMTSAQNGGRQARYEEAEALGIKFKKVWLATLDGHTRDLHADLDGVAVEPDEDFGYGRYAVEYPGDPYGLPEMVYNCRCTMITELKDYPRKYDERRARGEDGKTYLIKDMSYREWEAAKAANNLNVIVPQVASKKPVVEPNAIKLPMQLFNQKKSQALENYLASVQGKDQDVADLYGKIWDKASGKSYVGDIKVSYTDEGHAVKTWVYGNGDVAKIQIKIPKMDAGYAVSQSETTIHELGHFIDALYGDKSGLSEKNQKLIDAINHGNPMTDDMRKMFEDFGAKGRKAYDEAMKVIREKANDYNTRISAAINAHDYGAANNLIKERDKMWKDGALSANMAKREVWEGYNGLSDIYDAVTGGQLFASGFYGHGSRYYSNNANKASETFANYCALSQTSPKAFELLRTEQPEIFDACNELVKEMLNK